MMMMMMISNYISTIDRLSRASRSLARASRAELASAARRVESNIESLAPRVSPRVRATRCRRSSALASACADRQRNPKIIQCVDPTSES